MKILEKNRLMYLSAQTSTHLTLKTAKPIKVQSPNTAVLLFWAQTQSLRSIPKMC